MYNLHKNAVLKWHRDGLEAIDDGRPMLFQGETARAFLTNRNANRKRPCLPGTIYCFRCRQARRPAGAMADYLPVKPTSGNLRAICETCETMMHRRIRLDAIASKMPGIDVQVVQAVSRLVGEPSP